MLIALVGWEKEDCVGVRKINNNRSFHLRAESTQIRELGRGGTRYLSRCIDASMLSSKLASLLPPYFLDIYSLSTSSLEWKALCMVNWVLVIWSICLSSSLVHFKNGPEYRTRGTGQVLISFIRLLLYRLVSSRFFLLLRYSFLIISFISTCLRVSTSNIPNIPDCIFSLHVLEFPDIFRF